MAELITDANDMINIVAALEGALRISEQLSTAVGLSSFDPQSHSLIACVAQMSSAASQRADFDDVEGVHRVSKMNVRSSCFLHQSDIVWILWT